MNEDYSIVNAAGNRTTTYLTLGIILLLVGAGLIGFNWPGTEFDPSCDTFLSDPSNCTRATGNPDLVALGFAVAGVGQILTLIGCIAVGVRAGVESALEVRASRLG